MEVSGEYRFRHAVDARGRAGHRPSSSATRALRRRRRQSARARGLDDRGAQPADSFEELEGSIERGAVVEVTYGQRQIEGRILDLSPTSLTLVAEGRRLQHDAAAVTGIRQRWHDPARDGTLRGSPLGSSFPSGRCTSST